jgi:hypothetical protein
MKTSDAAYADQLCEKFEAWLVEVGRYLPAEAKLIVQEIREQAQAVTS